MNEDNDLCSISFKEFSELWPVRKCFICLHILSTPVTTNCGHTFCSDCFITHCTQQQGLNQCVKCPLCYQIVMEPTKKSSRFRKMKTQCKNDIQGISNKSQSSDKFISYNKETRSDIFNKQSENPNVSKRPYETQTTKHIPKVDVVNNLNDTQSILDTQMLTDDENGRIKIVDWLFNTQNKFDELTCSQHKFGGDTTMDDEELISITQAVTKTTPSKNHTKQVKRNRPPKKQGRYERRCRSLDIHFKKTSKSKLKRQTIACESQYTEGLQNEEVDNTQVHEMIEQTNMLRMVEEACLDSFDNQVETTDKDTKENLNTCIKNCEELKDLFIEHHSNYPQLLSQFNAYCMELRSILSNRVENETQYILSSQSQEIPVIKNLNVGVINKNCEHKNIQTDDVLFAADLKVVTSDKDVQTCHVNENIATQTVNTSMNKSAQTYIFEYKSVGSQIQIDKLITNHKQIQTSVCETNSSTQTEDRQGFYITANEAFATLSYKESYAQTDQFVCLNCKPCTSQIVAQPSTNNLFELSGGFDGIDFETQAILANENNKTVINRTSQGVPSGSFDGIDFETQAAILANENNKTVISRTSQGLLSGSFHGIDFETQAIILANENNKTVINRTSQGLLSGSFHGLDFETQAAILANEKNKTVINRTSQGLPGYTVTQMVDKMQQATEEQSENLLSINLQTDRSQSREIKKDFTSADNREKIGSSSKIQKDNNSFNSKVIILKGNKCGDFREKIGNNSKIEKDNNPLASEVNIQKDSNCSNLREKVGNNSGISIDNVMQINNNSDLCDARQNVSNTSREKVLQNNATTSKQNNATTSKHISEIDLDKVVHLNTVTIDIDEKVQMMLASLKKVEEAKASTSLDSSQNSNLRISVSMPSRSKRKLCFNEAEYPFDSDSDIVTPNKKCRKLIRDDISIHFDTETQNESLHVVEGLESSDVDMNNVDTVLNNANQNQPTTTQQKKPLPEIADEDKQTQELIEKCNRLIDHVTNQFYHKNTNVAKPIENTPVSLSSILDTGVLKDFQNDFIMTNENPTTRNTFSLDSLYNTPFELNNLDHNKENQYTANEAKVANGKRITVLQDINVTANDNEEHTDEDLFKSDCEDVIEDTPTKQPRHSILDRSENNTLHNSIQNQTPPNNLNNKTIVNETEIDTKITDKKQSSESINFIESISPISNAVKKVNIGSQMKGKKRCQSTPKEPKQLSMRRFIAKEESTGSEVFKIFSQPKMKVKPCIACSRLPKSQISIIHKLTSSNLATYSAVFTSNVTHMIVSTANNNAVKDHTSKFVSAVAAGIWVLNFKWIEDCLVRKTIIYEEPYEVLDESGIAGPKTARLNHKTTKLLKNFRIFAAPPFTSTAQDELEKIIIMQGGSVVNRPDDLMDKVPGEICLIITETKPTEDYEIYETWLELLKVLTVDLEWLVRSIGQYKLMSLRPFAMCSDESFGDLNYPDYLLETVPDSNSEDMC